MHSALFTKCARSFVLAAILLSLTSCSKESGTLADLGHVLSAGTVDEAVKMAGANKRITLIVAEPGWKAATTVADELEAALKKRGVMVARKGVNIGDPMGNSFGLKSGDFFDAIAGASDTGAIVSLVGAPVIKAGEPSRLGATHPPILIVTTSQLVPGDQTVLMRLLDEKVIDAAIVDGTDTAAPKSEFSAHYRILRRPN
jgi:hypothetical protein